MLVLIIRYEKHATKRLLKRSCYFDIDEEEAFIRTEETLFEGRLSKTKHSKHNKVYYKYYQDNLSFFVVVQRRGMFWIIKTVIIRRGRE